VFPKHAKVVLSGVHRPLKAEGRRVWSRGIPREDVREDVGEDDRGHARSREGGKVDGRWNIDPCWRRPVAQSAACSLSRRAAVNGVKSARPIRLAFGE
jgi:phage terminase large subunit GpA-like protein